MCLLLWRRGTAKTVDEEGEEPYPFLQGRLFHCASYVIIIFSAISRNPIVYNNVGVKTQSADRCHAQTISLPYKGKEKGCEGK